MRMGLASRTLLPLIAGTAALLGLATWAAYARSVGAARAAALAMLDDRARDRTRREDAYFARVERQLRHAHRLLEERWRAGADGEPPPRGRDGSRRALPDDGAAPLAVFVAARVTAPAVLRATAVARGLLAELGPAWCEGLAGLAVSAPGAFMVGYGDDKVQLAADMLPDDPVVLRDEQQLVDGAGEEVRWSRAWLEPASGARFVSAATAAELSGVGRVLITQTLPVDVVLARAAEGLPAGTRTLVFEPTGTVLAGDERAATPAVRALIAGSAPVERGWDPEVQAWLAVSRIPGPGWTMVTIQPAAELERAGRRSATFLLVAGLALLAVQVALLVATLRALVAQPLRRLVGAAGRLAAGERGVALDAARRDEIGDLSRAFSRMDDAVAAKESELREALATLRAREEFARALVDSAADAVVVLSADGTVIEANPRAAALFGAADAAALAGRRLGGPPPDPVTGDPLAARLAAAHRGAPQHFAWRAQRVDRTPFDAEVGLARVDIPGEERLLAVIRDVTERNRIEEHLRQAQKLETVGQLAGGVAHDFNNMLAGIMGAAELLLREDDPARRRELADSILVSCERSAGLTRRLLDFARKGQPTQVPLDVHAVVRDTLALVERTVDRRIVLVTDLAAARRTVIGDATQLQNALLNLALNARDAMSAGGRLVIRSAEVELDAPAAAALHGMAAPGPHVALSVVDHGTGIAPEILPRIFEPFFTTKPVGKGTGLGLTGVYRAACDHRGGIAIAPTPGGGTTFVLHLPLAPGQAAPERSAVTAPRAARPALVLVVDDEEIVRTLAASMLEVLGYRTVAAADGPQALVAFGEHPEVEAVLLDSEMPGMRGRDCLRALRARDPRLTAVLCSGFSQDAVADADDLAAEGIVAVVAKPFRMYDLARAIALALERRA